MYAYYDNYTSCWNVMGNCSMGARELDHSVLWNAMIYPFLNMTIKGAIRYQGESNAGKCSTNWR